MALELLNIIKEYGLPGCILAAIGYFLLRSNITIIYHPRRTKKESGNDQKYLPE
ncbi:MAG: hypothetical protein SVY10_06875 [Thermodesulfobacteriota bacterium]|nr:hypothetical protein [Thermodesulfobacteriota bacterium]